MADFTGIERFRRTVRIFGFASALGGPEPGCADGPEALARLARGELPNGDLPRASRGPVLRAQPTDGEPLPVIAQLCERLARHTYSAARRGEVPVVLGGDHSCAVGTWSGVSRAMRPA